MYSAATSRVGPLRIMKSWGWTHFFLHLIRPPQQAAVSNGSRSFVASWRVWVFTAACVREAASFRSWIRPQCRVTCTRYVEEKMERQNKIGWHKNKIWNAKNKNGQQKERKTLDQDTGPRPWTKVEQRVIRKGMNVRLLSLCSEHNNSHTKCRLTQLCVLWITTWL